eukprot:10192140-Lingulodinium_polyedra.AAC.1
MREISAGPAPYGMMPVESWRSAGLVAASSVICGVVQEGGNEGQPTLRAGSPGSRAQCSARTW